MYNESIADQLSFLAKLMDLHGENSFRARTYQNAAFTIEKLEGTVAELSLHQLAAVKGIGESVAQKVHELLDTGQISALNTLIQKTPPGVLHMMQVKGLGPKKVQQLWKEAGISNIPDLKKACEAGTIASIKGFGEKTQEKILASIKFIEQSGNKFLYADAEGFVAALQQAWAKQYADDALEIAGDYSRQLPVVEELIWVTAASAGAVIKFLQHMGIEIKKNEAEVIEACSPENIPLRFIITSKEKFGSQVFRNNCSPSYLSAWQKQFGLTDAADEKNIFKAANLPYQPPYLREQAADAGAQSISDPIKPHHIKGLIHAHSKWSDGSNTLEEMAQALIARNQEYLVITDHSQAAYYASGLEPERILKQHAEIDALNKKLAPFKIFKSIECDILNDGRLDYDDNILSSFDLVIASVHSNLQMSADKAALRLMGAIQNPHTTIMGHLTGRLLLRRPGYPVDHKAIINACAQHGVAIEINANPWRLDLDWQWIRYALEQGVLLSINPDAHAVDEFDNNRYGVLVAQKGGLQPAQNLSSFSLKEFEKYLANRKA